MRSLTSRIGHLTDVGLTKPNRLDIAVISSNDYFVAEQKQRFDELLESASLTPVAHLSVKSFRARQRAMHHLVDNPNDSA